MGDVALTQLIPIQELTPGAVGAIRNAVINQVVAQASRELNMPADRLVVRDILPYTDLGWDYGAATAGTTDQWLHDATSGAVGFYSVIATSGGAQMGDMRYVAIFGVRDLRGGLGATTTATEVSTNKIGLAFHSKIKIIVGGADKVVWEVSCLSAYIGTGPAVAFAPTAVIIPQNTQYDIQFYESIAKSTEVTMQLIGVTVEPRGKLISP